MARCNCAGEGCRCRLVQGEGVTITGAGTARDPWVVSAEGAGAGGASGWAPGDLKDTVAPSTPAGWLECNGQAVGRSSYPNLYAAIGSQWGQGDGFSTFNLPDFSGRTRVGAGPGYALAGGGGAERVTLTEANLPAHKHTMAHTHTINHDHGSFLTATGEGKHSHAGDLKVQSVPIGKDEAGNNSQSVARGPDAPQNDGVTNPLTWAAGGEHRHTVNVPNFGGSSGQSSTQSTGIVGQGASFSNMPPYRVVRVLIKT